MQMISREQIQRIVLRANLAPSGDNCQPWTFTWDSQKLKIYHNELRSRHPADPESAATAIALGCLLESIVIAASEFNLQAHFKLNEIKALPVSCWAEVEFTVSTVGISPLVSILEQRSTDRRIYRNGKIDLSHFADLLNQNTAQYSTAHLHVSNFMSPQLVDYMINSEQFLMDHPSMLPAVMQMTRLTNAEAKRTRDGLSCRNMLIKFWEIPVIFLIKKFPSFFKIIKIIMRPQHRARAKQQLRSSAGLFCVSIAHHNGLARFHEAVYAGMLMMQAWLRLTKLGFAVQPQSLSVFPIYFEAFQIHDPFYLSKRAHVELGKALLKQSFSIDSARVPVWIIRTGLSDPLPTDLRTLRKPIEDILTFT